MPKYNIRLANNRDKEGVLNLLNDVFSENQTTKFTRGEDFWNWKFKDNPFGESLLTIAEQERIVVGVDNLWPWQFKLNGKTYKALQPCDSVVHAEHRRQGIFKAMRTHGLEMAKKNKVDFVFNFPNRNSLPTNLSLGWSLLGKLPWVIRINEPFKVLRSKLKKTPSVPAQVNACYSIDYNTLDGLAYKYGANGLIEVNRIGGYHRWRYLQKPVRNYGMITYHQAGQEAIASVFTLNTKEKGNNEMFIVDILGDMSLFIPLMKKVIRESKKMEVSFIALMDNPLLKRQKTMRYGFLPLNLKQMVVKVLSANIDQSQVNRFSNWCLMAAMHDSI